MQLVFVVFTGEAWGYLGSRRFLEELDMHSDAVHGLSHSLVETVLKGPCRYDYGVLFSGLLRDCIINMLDCL